MPEPVGDGPRGPQTAFDRHLGERRPLRLLLAEDNATNVLVGPRVPECLGYRADVAGNGWEVLDALRRQSYDAVGC